ncbi:EEF1A lysine methyltransferase 2 [Eumeta japonica]|uniref:Protein-lysine N-methyltransferase EVAR_6918_1 n=1 Tax=Eumeta variegata TaxID=151549 RepID=A0A4C1THG3_EUMVA|nr:EEF1A lysine methyltransferase 2 [Eumeta japonica]
MDELESSELGTHEYWKNAYATEIENFQNHGDPGDVWFGEDSAFRIIRWIYPGVMGVIPLSSLDLCLTIVIKLYPVLTEPRLCDLSRVKGWIQPYLFTNFDKGCGNGYTLIELAKEGFTNLLGIDYCEEAITLAKKLAEKEHQEINYKVFDITKEDPSELGKFNIIHDKGTYDSISLNPIEPKTQRELYIEHVENMLDNCGYFIITSCNWTERELVEQFSIKLKLHCVIPTPQFKFGGKVGSVVSSLVFKK